MKKLLTALMLAAILASAAHAQNKAGTTFGAFLLIEPDARLAAMGNAGVSLYDGVGSAYFNPASTGAAETFGVQFTHVDWFAGITYDHVTAVLPMGTRGNLFGSVTSLNSGDIDVRTVASPLGTGERYTVSDVALGVGWAKQISLRFSAGVQVNYVQETIWHSSASTMVVNVGTLFRLSKDGLHIGSSLSHFGTNSQFDGRDLRVTFDGDPTRYGDNGTLPATQFTDRFAVPVLFRVGLGKPFRIGDASRLFVAADAIHPSDNSESVNLGAEWSLRDVVALRGGYQGLFLEDSEIGLTAGVGLKGRVTDYRYRLDYAWADQGRLQASHRLTVGVEF